ncbi:unnamed protein product, partial [Brassica napus]
SNRDATADGGSSGRAQPTARSSAVGKHEFQQTNGGFVCYRMKEEEIEKNKMEIRERVQAQLGRVEEETKRLALIREELEGLAEPMRKEVALARKKIDSVNKELKPLGHTVQKKEREYKEALEAFNEKNREKVQLITKLTEVSQLILKSFSFFYLLNIVIGDSV